MNISTTLAERSESNAMVFPVSSIGDEKGRIQKKYGICIPPVHDEISVGKIIEFLELTQILGASHFTFYDLSVFESVRNVLNYYQDLALVSVFPWNLIYPRKLEKTICTILVNHWPSGSVCFALCGIFRLCCAS